MNILKILSTALLTTSLLSIPAFAQQNTATPASTSQVIASQGLDIYVDGASVATGALAYSNTAVTLSTRGAHTITAYPHGVAPASGTPTYKGTYYAESPTQMVHVVTDAAENINVY